MGNQQPFSHGLLYSVAPEDFSKLHLRDEDEQGGFDWEVSESRVAGSSFVAAMLDFLRGIAGH